MAVAAPNVHEQDAVGAGRLRRLPHPSKVVFSRHRVERLDCGLRSHEDVLLLGVRVRDFPDELVGVSVSEGERVATLSTGFSLSVPLEILVDSPVRHKTLGIPDRSLVSTPRAASVLIHSQPNSHDLGQISAGILIDKDFRTVCMCHTLWAVVVENAG